MNALPKNIQIQVLEHLVECNSIRATERLVRVHRDTIIRMVNRIGWACGQYQNQVFRNLKFKRIQCDELWAFAYAKKKNASEEMKDCLLAGDSWTWVAIDTQSRLIFSWLVAGNRDQEVADIFIQDVADRLSHRFQMSTDGNPYYLDAVQSGIIDQNQIDYGILMKTYKRDKNGKRNTKNLNIEKFKVVGNPKEKHISTGYIERYNGTLRDSVKRFARDTKAFSKKMQNLENHVALFNMYYNFVRIHSTFKATPAMVAGICDYKWEWSDVLEMVNGKRLENHIGMVA